MAFIKGQSGNPKTQFSKTHQPKVCGRRPSILRTLDRQYQISMTDQRTWYNYVRSLPVDELEALAGDKTLPVWQSEIARLQYKAIAKGELAVYRELQDRFYGKAAESLDVTSKGERLDKALTIEVIDSTTKVDKQGGEQQE